MPILSCMSEYVVVNNASGALELADRNAARDGLWSNSAGIANHERDNHERDRLTFMRGTRNAR